jgi:hypothetical protein
VAVGEAPIGSLRQVANADNLDRASNQLVVRARSRVTANRDLVRLFARNGWRELDERTEEDRARKAAVAKGMSPAGRASGSGAPEGLYYRASHNGEDLWVVLTTPDDLSRFATQMAQLRTLEVGAESSRPFQAVRYLQRQLALFEAQAGGGRAGGAGARMGTAPAKAAGEAGARHGGTGRVHESDRRGMLREEEVRTRGKSEAEAEETVRQTAPGFETGQFVEDLDTNGLTAQSARGQEAQVEAENYFADEAGRADALGAGERPEEPPLPTEQQVTGQVQAGALQERLSRLRGIPPNQVMLIVRVRSAEEPPHAAEVQAEPAEEAEPAEAEQRPAPGDQE